MKVSDSLYERRAHHLLSLAYVNVMKLGAGHERGIRSYAEKKWYSTSRYAKAAKGFGIVVAVGAGIASLVTVVAPVVGAAMIVTSIAVKQGLKRRKRKVAIASVRKWERKLVKEQNNTAAEQQACKDELRAAILRTSTVGEVVKHLATESNTLVRLANRYLGRTPSNSTLKGKVKSVFVTTPEQDDMKLWKRAEKDIGRRGSNQQKRNFWREFKYTNGFLTSKIDSKISFTTKVRKTTGGTTSAVAQAHEHCDSLRLAVKRITFYNALLMEYCRQMHEAQRDTLDKLNDCRVTLWKALLQQAHLTHGNHEDCSADMPCVDDMRMRARDLILFVESDPRDSDSITVSELEMFTEDDTEPKALSADEAKRLAKKLAKNMQLGDPAELYSQRTQPEPSAFGKKMAALLHASPGKIGAFAGTKGVKSGIAYAKHAIRLAATAKKMTVTGAQAATGTLSGVSMAFGELSDFAIGHWKKNVPASLAKARLETEFEAEGKDQNVLYQFANDFEARRKAGHGYYLEHLKTYCEQADADAQRGQVKAAIDKLTHYDKRFNRDYKKYNDLQKKVTAAGGFASCDEARELCEHFVAMFKTLRKEENCVNFVYALAQGYKEMLLDDNKQTSYWIPAKTATGLDNWFAFWRPAKA